MLLTGIEAPRATPASAVAAIPLSAASASYADAIVHRRKSASISPIRQVGATSRCSSDPIPIDSYRFVVDRHLFLFWPRRIDTERHRTRRAAPELIP